MFIRKVAWLVIGLALLRGEQSAVAGEAESNTFKRDLTEQRALELQELIRPHADEWRHLQVEWTTDVVAARRRAAEEDKPIVICYTGGAGYNEPLGVC